MSELTTFLPLKGEKAVYSKEYVSSMSPADVDKLFTVVGEGKPYSTENGVLFSTPISKDGIMYTMGLNPTIAAISPKTMVAVVETNTQADKDGVLLWMNEKKQVKASDTEPGEEWLPLLRRIVVIAEEKHLQNAMIETGMAQDILPKFKAQQSAISGRGTVQSELNRLLFEGGSLPTWEAEEAPVRRGFKKQAVPPVEEEQVIDPSVLPVEEKAVGKK